MVARSGVARSGVRRPQGASKKALKDRKRHQVTARAEDGVANGVVEIPDALNPAMVLELCQLARNVETRRRTRGSKARILAIAPFESGISIETEDERLAQNIADAIVKSRHARIQRVYDDEGKRRILTLRFS